MKRAEKLILIFGLIIAFGIAGTIILVINFSGEYQERDVSLTPFKAPQAKEAVVTFFSGEVYYFRDNQWKPVSIGEILKENDFVKTFENSYCEIQIGEKISFSMRENALLKLYVVLQTEDKTQSDSEILIGTVLYKVSKLDKEDDVIIRSGTRAFGVRGTEFLIDRSTAATTCAVRKGAVALVDPDTRMESIRIIPNTELTIADQQTAAAGITAVSNESSQMLKNIDNLKKVTIQNENGVKLVKTGIEVVPDSAEIFIDNRLQGTGFYAGLYPAGTDIAVRLHKDGYKDKSFTITAKQGENRVYVFKLEMEQPEKGIVSAVSDNETEKKIQALEKRITTLSSEKELDRREIERLKADKSKLEQQLKAANEKIKEAINRLQ